MPSLPLPNSKVQIIKDIKFNNSYNDVRLFTSKTDRDTYFTSKVVKTFSDFQYVRQYEGAVNSPYTRAECIKVPVDADSIIDCTYLRYQNTHFSNRWFYCFIDHINYINENCSEIVYTPDSFQTWFYDCTLHKCMIEREHSNASEEDEHITLESDFKFFTPEEVNPSTYQSQPQLEYKLTVGSNSSYSWLKTKTPKAIVLTTQWDKSEHDYTQAVVDDGGTQVTKDFSAYQVSSPYSCFLYFGSSFSGWLWEFPVTQNGLKDMFLFFQWMNGQPTTYVDLTSVNTRSLGVSLLSSAVIDSYFAPLGYSDSILLNSLIRTGQNNIVIDTIEEKPTSYWLTGHEIRNNKLYFYPYRKIKATSLSGGDYDFTYEQISHDAVGYMLFRVLSNPLPMPRLTLSPAEYKYVNNDITYLDYVSNNPINYSHNNQRAVLSNASNVDALMTGFSLFQFGANSFSYDRASSNAYGEGMSYSDTISGDKYGSSMNNGYNTSSTNQVSSRGGLHNVGNLITGVKNGYSSIKNSGAMPYSIMGRIASSDNSWLFDVIGFSIYPLFAPDKELEMFDNYFDYYGYNASGKFDYPRLEGRQYWNYCQTQNCNISGNVPEIDLQNIRRIFNKGARFWHTEIDKNRVVNPVVPEEE